MPEHKEYHADVVSEPKGEMPPQMAPVAIAGLKALWLGVGMSVDRRSDPAHSLRAVAFAKKYRLGGLFAAAVAFKWVSDYNFCVTFPHRYDAGVMIPHQNVFATRSGERVMLDEHGDAGRFNRASRASSNYNEYLPHAISLTALAAPVYPTAAAVGAGVFVAGRLLYAPMYSQHSDLRTPGFVLSTHFGLDMLEGLVTVAALRVLR
eukprot:TRINITY_DN9655_c0_g1_i1.p1 TRINITY_DN9655_c0_g1~~TRINITY_DN9655_c0_g1_i1.p1  ORF type:complete len:226 (+),score=76.24 TRINITY_DN9655_c0_g1_i1:63-680(+)